eukprot:365427-Chlamydomonas_euryale.AAC.2
MRPRRTCPTSPQHPKPTARGTEQAGARGVWRVGNGAAEIGEKIACCVSVLCGRVVWAASRPSGCRCSSVCGPEKGSSSRKTRKCRGELCSRGDMRLKGGKVQCSRGVALCGRHREACNSYHAASMPTNRHGYKVTRQISGKTFRIFTIRFSSSGKATRSTTNLDQPAKLRRVRTVEPSGRGATEKVDLFWKTPWKTVGSYWTAARKVHSSYTEAIRTFQVWKYEDHQVLISPQNYAEYAE